MLKFNFYKGYNTFEKQTDNNNNREYIKATYNSG